MSRWACGGVLVLLAAPAARSQTADVIVEVAGFVKPPPRPNALGGGAVLAEHRPVRAAQPAAPAPGPEARRDAHGDPLPPGAVARYGTVRLRHGTVPDGLAFSPDGAVLGSLADTPDGLRTWDPATGKEVARLGHRVRLGAFAGDGTVVFVDADDRVRVWTPAGNRVRDLPEKALPEGTQTVAVHPGGGEFAAAATGRVVLVDLRTGAPLRELKAVPGTAAVRLEYSPDGRWLAGGWEKGVWLWDLKTGKRVRTYPPGNLEFAFSPDGARLAVGGELLQVYPTDAEEPADGYAAPEGDFRSPRFTTDGAAVLALTPEGSVLRVDAATGRVGEPTKPPATKVQPPFALAPDAALAAAVAVGESGGIVVWDPKTGKGPAVERLPELSRPGFSADGKTVSALAPEGRVHTFDAATGRPGKVVELPDPAGRAVFWDPVARRAAVLFGEDELELRVFDGDTGNAVGKVPVPANADGAGVAFCPTDPDRVAVFCRGSVLVARAATGKPVNTLVIGKPADAPGGGAVSPDGRLVAVTGWPLAVWEVGTGKKRLGFDVVPSGAAFSPDGRYLAAWDVGGGPVSVFDLRVGVLVRRFAAAGTEVVVAFAPDGKRVAVGAGVAVSVWDVATGEEVSRFEGQDGVLTGVAWSPDGARLASASIDGTVVVWDATRKAADKPAAAAVAGFEEAVRLLGEADPAAAQRGMEYLYRRPAEAAREVAARVPAPAAAPAGRIAKLVADLDSDDFRVRSAAVRELGQIGGEAGPALRAVAAKSANPEARQLAADVLARIANPPPTAAGLRAERAVEVLEGLGTTDARAVLAKWAAGPAGNRTAADAAAALARLKARKE
jgi:WD40 repeat protein